MKFIKALFVLGLSQLVFQSAYADQRFYCSDRHQLTFYSRDGENRASWGKVLSEGVASCSFWEGHRYKNSDMGMFPEDLAKKGIWIYRGLGNACSDGQLLIFNEQTGRVMIINNYDFSTIIFACSEANR